ncbi:MAG: amino acid adenylation domain-containing protein [Caldilineaceae bacterium]
MFEHQPTITAIANNRPLTGTDYLASLRDGREVWIYGQRVPDVTHHPAFRNQTRMVARLYDALHDPISQAQLTCATDTGSGGYTHRFFRASRTVEELLAAREAIAAWQRIGYGWMGRSPDFVAAWLGMLGPNAEFYEPYQANAQRWYKMAQAQVPYVNHAIANPPVDRRLSPNEADKLYIHVVKETDAGLIVSGAKNITTNAALTNYSFVGGDGGTFVKHKQMAILFLTPMNAAGVKVICRPSYEMTASVMGSPFDYPLSSRFDENDAIFILDNVLIPWENVFIYGDANKYNNHMQESGLYHRAGLQACTRLAVKLDLITGLLLQAVETTGVDQFRGVQVNLGEVMTWRHLFWSLSDAMVHSVTTLNGAVIPKLEHMMSYRMLMAMAYPRVKEITQQLVASGLIYQPSSALDFKTPELRTYLDQYVRGPDGDSVARIKLMRTLWDALSSEFGGRHELYERNHSGNHEAVRLHPLFHAMNNGTAAQLKGFANQCMSEVDLDGWTTRDLINPHDVNFFQNQGQTPLRPHGSGPTYNNGHAAPSPVAMNGDRKPSPPADGAPLTNGERHKILVEGNNTAPKGDPDSPKDQCIHQLFEAQVARTPEAIAVISPKSPVIGQSLTPKTADSLTYAELNARANQLAHYLQTLGVGPETLVGICVERSLDMIVGILGILKAGGAYLPLDPHYPQARLAFMLTDAAPPVLLGQASTIANFPANPAQVVLLDQQWATIAQQPRTNLVSRVNAANLAYVIYTSGSTGEPKGVLLEQRGLCNVVEAQKQMFGLTPKDRVLQFSSLNFDAATFEIWLAFGVGASLYLGTAETLAPGEPLLQFLINQQITMVTLTPSTLAMLPVSTLPALHTLSVAGEACSSTLIQTWATGRRFFNLYGPTEATIWSTAWQAPNASPHLPLIGRPILNTQVYILDAIGQPADVGVAGELHLGGVGIARGYLNRPALTAQKFVPNPFGAGTLYKTGDLARWLPDGTLEFLGRIDRQVKIRGFRIEPDEIETVLAQHPALQQAVVVAREGQSGDRQLVAYVVPRAGCDLQPALLRSYLQTKLPHYLIPTAFVLLDALPLTPNGKVDRSALPSPRELPQPALTNQTPPNNPVQAGVAAIWCDVLDKAQVDIHDNFIELGGHSLQVTQILTRIQNSFQVVIPMSQFFNNPTVAALAQLIQRAQTAPVDAVPADVASITRLAANMAMEKREW